MTMHLILKRIKTSDEGTIGVLLSTNIFILELPERDNEKQFSRIPASTYICEWKKSPKFGYCYQLREVSNRGNILIHSGNFAGDTRMGYLSHSYGCLLPALKIGRIDGQLAGLLSRVALRRFYEITKKQTFTLEIRDA